MNPGQTGTGAASKVFYMQCAGLPHTLRQCTEAVFQPQALASFLGFLARSRESNMGLVGIQRRIRQNKGESEVQDGVLLQSSLVFSKLSWENSFWKGEIYAEM